MIRTGIVKSIVWDEHSLVYNVFDRANNRWFKYFSKPPVIFKPLDFVHMKTNDIDGTIQSMYHHNLKSETIGEQC